tara:strand:- start:405 stop:1079 length:675 start_codon:yes stop_codon:yes gene_type:complete
MFIKLFNQILDSSIADDRRLRHFFTDIMLCCDSAGFVMMTEAAISRRIGTTIDEVKWGLAELMKPDPRSKTPDHEGRRIEAVEGSGYGWRVINFEAYKSIRSTEDMRDKTRDRVRRFRAKKKGTVDTEPTHNTPQKKEAPSIELPHGEDFAAAWSRWRSHRSEIKKPLKPTSELAQLKRLGNTPEGLAVATIDHTIEMGWQGLRAPEPQNKSTNAPTQSNTYGI